MNNLVLKELVVIDERLHVLVAALEHVLRGSI